MADPPRNIDTLDATGVEPDGGPTTGIARWQKVVGIIGLVVVLGLGVLMFGPGGGGHGPSPSAPGGDTSGVEAPAGEAPPAGGHAPPGGGHG